MGMRLTINGDDGYGKCYGYSKGVHLTSLDYLISINAFVDWETNTDKDYEGMLDYFSWCPSTDTISLSREQFLKFIELYTNDIRKLYEIEDYEWVPYEFPDCNSYTIEWG